MCKNMDNLNIGGVPLKSHAVLAPMAGVSDRAYRELCVRFGAAYCVSEMVSSKALSFNSKKSEELMEISDLERPCGIQIFGDDPKCMADAAKHALENKPDIIDINMGWECFLMLTFIPISGVCMLPILLFRVRDKCVTQKQ